MSNLVLDIQRRHAEVFRIRLGTKDGRGFPTKLTDAIRVTSRGESVVAAFTRVYGGEVRPWDNGGEPQFEAFLPTTALHVMILPGQSIWQRWEKYSRSVCERRCNGQHEEIEGRPCVCPSDIDARMVDKGSCNIMTRINVICPDVEVVGAGALVSHGLIAAETLPQSVGIAEAALSRGVMVPAVLRVVEHKGKTHYVVPNLEIVGVSLNQLESGTGAAAGQVGAGAPVQIAPAAAAALPAGPRGVPPLPGEVHTPEIVTPADVGGEVDGGAGPVPMGGSDPAPPSADRPPSTGVDLADLEQLMGERAVSRPALLKQARVIAESLGEDRPAQFRSLKPGALLDAVYAWVEAQTPPDDDPASAPAPETSGGGDGTHPELAAATPTGAAHQQTAAQKALHARLADKYPQRTRQDQARHALIAQVTGGRTESSAQAAPGELVEALRLVDECDDPQGGWELHLNANGAVVLRKRALKGREA